MSFPKSLSWALLFVALPCFITNSGSLVDAIAAPKLDVFVSNENKQQIKPGESFWYSFKISHNTSSNADAKDVQLTWYIPSYIKYERILSGGSGINVDVHTNALIFKKSALSQGSSINVKFQVNLDNTSEISKGHHYAVSALNIHWYSTSSVQYHLPLKSHSMDFVVPGCSDALGMTDGNIKSHQLIASSWLPSSRPEMARFNNDAWCALNQDSNQFIQVLFTRKTKITKIATWGRSLKKHWVKTYSIQYSDDNTNWKTYMENGYEKIFAGNSEVEKEMSHWLLYPFSANYVRINPKTWHTQICMRFELHGCQISENDNCVNPLGMENGLIPDEALSQLTKDPSGLYNPAYARLNKKIVQFPNGWAPSSDHSKKEWIQIDLGSMHKITRTAIQGSSNDPPSFFVKNYKLQYSNNSNVWTTFQENGKDKLFKGPETTDAATFPTPAFFSKPIYTRYLRLIPEEYSSLKVLRMEIYGCLSEEIPNQLSKVNDTEFSRRSVLFDKKNSILYVCVFRTNRKESSCKSTTDGKVWKDLNERVVNIIGYDTTLNKIYGLDRNLSYMYSKDGGKTWIFIPTEEWNRRKNSKNMILSTKLKDILVSTTPSMQWASNAGNLWGGKGIHMKMLGGNWNLAASWKCCGQ